MMKSMIFRNVFRPYYAVDGNIGNMLKLNSASQFINCYQSDLDIRHVKASEKSGFALPWGGCMGSDIGRWPKLSVRHMSQILDDFMFFSPASSPKCKTYLETFLTLAAAINIPIKQKLFSHLHVFHSMASSRHDRYVLTSANG